jgi:hypothetical protein
MARSSPGLLAAVFLLLIAARAGAQPRGNAHLWGEERYEAWGPFGEVRNWDGARLHADGRFYPVNAGAWTFWLDAAETGQELRFSAQDIPSRWGRWSAQLGDYVVEEPRRDALRTEFQQVAWARGASIGVDRGPIALTLHGGTLTEHRSIFGWGREPLFEPIYGAMLHGRWSEHNLWKVDWTRQEGSPGLRPGLHLATAFMGRTPPQGWSWLGQVRASREDSTGTLGESAIAGGGYASGKFTSSGHLRIISPGFRSVGLYPDPHQNEWGARIEASYRPRPAVLVGTSWDWGKDLEPRLGQVVPESRLISRFFATSNLVGPLTLRADLGYRNRSTTDPESLLVDQNAVTWESALGWSTPRGQAEMSLSRTIFRDPLALTGDWHEDRVGFTGQERLAETWRLEARGWTVNRRFLDGTWASRERKLQVQGNWEPHSEQRVWLSLAREHQDASDSAYRRDQWEVGAGWDQPLPWALSFELESLFFVRAGDYEADRTRVSFRLMRGFDFGGGAPGFRQGLPEFGTIRGRVFEDLNGNGVADAGEHGLAGLPIQLASGGAVTTDTTGAYVVKQAATIYESVGLDVGRLPTRYLAPSDPQTVFHLRPGQQVVRDFAVHPAAAVAGRVMLDLGNHAVGVPDVLLRVDGTHQDVFTDAEGRFYIPGLEAGEITLEVVGWSLPKDAELESPGEKTVRPRAGRAVNAGLFVLKPKPVPVIQTYQN